MNVEEMEQTVDVFGGGGKADCIDGEKGNMVSKRDAEGSVTVRKRG